MCLSEREEEKEFVRISSGRLLSPLVLSRDCGLASRVFTEDLRLPPGSCGDKQAKTTERNSYCSMKHYARFIKLELCPGHIFFYSDT